MRSKLVSAVVWVGIVVLAHVAVAGPEVTRIQAVEVTQQAEVTRVRVHAAKPLEFTVYKLDRPSRVVLDLPRARLADALTGHDSAMVLTPSTWSVSTVGAAQLDDGGIGVRLSITLARPGRYEVKPDGSDLIVIVTARDPAPLATSDATAQLETERQARARAEQASAAAQKEAASAKELAAQARSEADRRAAKAAEAQRIATEQATKAARDEATRTRAEADRARIAAETAERDSESRRVAAEVAARNA
ncbi:MAG TPA: AMIN domain-containing protein, partial [Kofleriaceae bacterium]